MAYVRPWPGIAWWAQSFLWSPRVWESALGARTLIASELSFRCGKKTPVRGGKFFCVRGRRIGRVAGASPESCVRKRVADASFYLFIFSFAFFCWKYGTTLLFSPKCISSYPFTTSRSQQQLFQTGWIFFFASIPISGGCPIRDGKPESSWGMRRPVHNSLVLAPVSPAGIWWVISVLLYNRGNWVVIEFLVSWKQRTEPRRDKRGIFCRGRAVQKLYFQLYIYQGKI